jgi:hypothetical protein
MIPLLADALTVAYWIGMIAVPIIIGVQSYRQAQRAGEAVTKQLHDEQRGQNSIPIARVCPSCGSTDSKKGPPLEEHFLFNFDRVCNGCGTLYSQPFPAWLAIAVIGFGGVLIVAGIAAGIYVSYKFPQDWRMIIAPAVGGLGIGLLCIYGGIVKLKAARDLPQ